MARLIVKSPYFKGGGAKPAGGYLRYIATRERVEILPDDRPPTKRQTQLIEKLTKDFPDTKTLLEYGDYTSHPTKFNASQFLTLAMEENWSKVQEIDGYAKYIATRPRAERMGEHGLPRRAAGPPPRCPSGPGSTSGPECAGRQLRSNGFPCYFFASFAAKSLARLMVWVTGRLAGQT